MEPFFSQERITDDAEDGNHKIDSMKSKDLIANLPRENGWARQWVDLHQYEGFWYYTQLLQGILSVQQHLQSKSSDILIVSSPKTGTTWLKALAFAIVTRKRFNHTTSPLLSQQPHDLVPSLESYFVKGGRYDTDPEIPLIATHMPYASLPNSIIKQNCKIVYIWRDAKDTFVSLWHFLAKGLILKGLEPITLEEAFEMFCNGISFCGPYPDHVLQYWNAKLKNPDKILFLKYEELFEDTAFYTKKLAEFMGYPFTMEEEENQVLQRIVEMCSFEKLKNLEVNKSGHHKHGLDQIENKIFFRKGKVGDWCNFLTNEMGARLDMIMENKLKGTNLIIK